MRWNAWEWQVASRRTLETSVLKPQWSMKWFSSLVFFSESNKYFWGNQLFVCLFPTKIHQYARGEPTWTIWFFFSLATLYLEYVTESLHKKSECSFLMLMTCCCLEWMIELLERTIIWGGSKDPNLPNGYRFYPNGEGCTSNRNGKYITAPFREVRLSTNIGELNTASVVFRLPLWNVELNFKPKITQWYEHD